MHPDSVIFTNKGPTLMKDEERVAMVKACKWVDEVAFGMAYGCDCKLLDSLDCEYCVHGDDMPVDPSGNSVYQDVIDNNRCRIIKRTEGVSTTELVGRLLSMSREHLMKRGNDGGSESESASASANEAATGAGAQKKGLLGGISNFLPTSHRLTQFANADNPLHKATKVVYVDGDWDLFHLGHVEFLERAAKLGDFVLVGVHDDAVVNAAKGVNFPIMGLHERVFNVLSCKYVNDVIIGAPWALTQDMLKTMNIQVVVVHADNIKSSISDQLSADPYAVAREAGILEQTEFKATIDTDVLIERMIENRKAYVKRNEKKGKAEMEYLANKTFIQEK